MIKKLICTDRSKMKNMSLPYTHPHSCPSPQEQPVTNFLQSYSKHAYIHCININKLIEAQTYQIHISDSYFFLLNYMSWT